MLFMPKERKQNSVLNIKELSLEEYLKKILGDEYESVMTDEISG